MPHPLSRRIGAVLDLDPSARAIQYDGGWSSWGQIGTAARRIGTAAGARRVGIMLRNTPVHVAALLGVLEAGGTVVVINPSRGDERTRAEIAALALPVIVGLAEDLANLDPAHLPVASLAPAPFPVASLAPALPPVAALAPAPFPVASLAPGPHAGTALVTITDLDTEPAVAGEPATDAGRPGVAVWMLTSGTTGPPKRVDLTYTMLARSVMGRNPENAPDPTRLRTGVAIVNSPLVHIGGVFRILLCIAEARPFVLLPKFDLERWAAAVREHRPRAVSLVPAALRMVLHSELTRDDLAGVQAVTSGTAPLSADDADAFTAKFGIPVLTSYAATEFGGGVAGWTLSDHRQYWAHKRGSVGRANPGARLRVVDEAGRPLGPDRQGLLEVIPAQVDTTEWLRTTDVARIDADGFVWILGRADQAIIRGGFKVMPDDVRAALEAHPAVRGAAVIGRPDERLGETPVAMVELHGEATETELSQFLAARLARYEVPTAIAIVDVIPRTPSGKADLAAVRAHFT